jgi:hypothetical protein
MVLDSSHGNAVMPDRRIFASITAISICAPDAQIDQFGLVYIGCKFVCLTPYCRAVGVGSQVRSSSAACER